MNRQCIPNAGDTLRVRLVRIFETSLDGLPLLLESDHLKLEAFRLPIVFETLAFSTLALQLRSLAFQPSKVRKVGKLNLRKEAPEQ